MSVELEIEFRPAGEFRQEVRIPAETCEGGLGAARPTTDIASQYTTADKPEVTVSQEVTASLSIPHTRNRTPHTFPKAKMADYTRTTIKLPQEVALSLDQQITRQHNVKV